MTASRPRVRGTAPLLLALASGCGMSLTPTTIDQAHLGRFDLYATQDGGEVTALIYLRPDDDTVLACPLLAATQGTLGGAPLTALSRGAVEEVCIPAPLGGCSSRTEQRCRGSSWQLVGVPPGPLTARFSEPGGAALEVQLADLGSPRGFEVLSVQDGAGGDAGQLDLRWGPPLDLAGWAPTWALPPGRAGLYGLYGLSFQPDGGSPLFTTRGSDRLPPAASLDGGVVRFHAALAFGGPFARSYGGPGTLLVQVRSAVQVTRCPVPVCLAELAVEATAPVTWYPFR